VDRLRPHRRRRREYGARWTTLADPEGNLFDVGDDGA
jgi:hypothetical protein